MSRRRARGSAAAAHLATAAWALGTLALLLAPAEALPGAALAAWAPWGTDKLVHALLFAVLALLAARSARCALLPAPRLLAALLATAWGGLGELLQGLGTRRSAELGDLLADALGAAAALAVAALLGRRRAGERSGWAPEAAPATGLARAPAVAGAEIGEAGK